MRKEVIQLKEMIN